ncbi:MAG: hypothetical protein Q7S58_21445 [Candidatus Binatus sp.]|uniref:hypothetical protein n=1 Tax=Candidatus Binatus sp. TaxID=2811406 RepID=UPI00271F1BDD|nr:hypothetical protein [Candidatus Binatus sp.]MDO8434972.1 hypothetical protein [Candidatus Binatus sp.]
MEGAKLAVSQFVRDELSTVSGNPYEPITRRLLTISQVGGKLRFGICAFFSQIRFEFKNGPTDQGIEPAADFR